MENLDIDYEELYNIAPCGYICSSPAGDIIEVNNRFLDFMGYKKEEVVSQKTFQDFLSKAGKVFFETSFLPTLKMQGIVKEVNFSMVRRDDVKIPVLVNSIEVKDDEGNHLYTQCTVFDISLRKMHEIQLLDAKKKAEQLSQELQATNQELSRKNRLLEGGIKYSKKIQYSILPAKEKILSTFKDLFIYFQPKGDIGGDFYWYAKKDNYAFMAVIDCTGHGVPGALMSMSINALLNEIMSQEQTTDPGEILGLLHEKVYYTLQQKQGDEYSQDGCDIILCRFDLTTKQLIYAGANNDLYIYTNGDLQTIKATKKSIGGTLYHGTQMPVRKFVSTEVHYTEESLIIMTTDGIMDQLNESDEAFYINEFYSMIDELNAKEIALGKEVVACSIGNWMQHVPQLDDILMVGFKIGD